MPANWRLSATRSPKRYRTGRSCGTLRGRKERNRRTGRGAKHGLPSCNCSSPPFVPGAFSCSLIRNTVSSIFSSWYPPTHPLNPSATTKLSSVWQGTAYPTFHSLFIPQRNCRITCRKPIPFMALPARRKNRCTAHQAFPSLSLL